MALSEAMRKRIQQNVAGKNGGSSNTSAAPTTSSETGRKSTRLSSSIVDQIHRNVAMKRLGREEIGVDEDFVDRFMHDSQFFMYKSQYDWNNMDYRGSKDENSFAQRAATEKDLADRATALRTYLDIYGDSIDEDAYRSMTEYLDQFDMSRAGIMNNFDALRKYYSQWENEEMYNISQMSADELKAKIDGIGSAEDDLAIVNDLLGSNMPYRRDYAEQDGRDMAVYDIVEQNRAYIAEKYGIEFSEDYIANDEQLFALVKQLEEGQSGIAYTTKDGQNVTWQMLYDGKFASEDLQNRLGEYSQNADWEEMSKGIDTADDTLSDYNIIFELQQSMMPYDRETAIASGVDMAQYEEVEQKRRYIEDKYGVDLHADIYENTRIFGQLMEQTDPNVPGEKDFFDNLSYLTDEERSVLSYIYNTQGREAALAWHESREQMYADRQSGVLAEVMTYYGQENPFWGSVGSVALGIGGSLEQVGDMLDYVATGEVGHNSFSEASSALRSGTMEKVDWEIGNFDAFDFLYGTTMSGVDSFVQGQLFGPGAEVMLGLGAAAQATKDAKDRGMSDKQAFWTGISAGVAEGLFEHWSIGNFSSLKEVVSANAWDIAKNIGKSMLVNASEEALTEVANIIYDSVMNGEFSQYDTMVRQYVANGIPEEEAVRQVLTQMLYQVGEAGASGALMGLGFGTLGSAGPIAGNAMDAVYTNRRNTGIAKDTIQAEGGIDALRSLAEDVAGVSDTKMQRRLTTQSERVGKKATTRNVRKLYEGVSSAYSAQDKADISKSLVGKGIQEKTANAIAEAIVDSGNGKILTRKQQDLLTEYKDNKDVRTALQETGAGTFERAMKMATFETGAAIGNLKGFAASTKADAAAPRQENKTAEGKVLTEEKTSYEVSEDGKSHLKSSGEEVAVVGVATTKDGQMTVKLEDGRNVDVQDVSFGNAGQAMVYETVAEMGVSAETANALVQAYDPGGDISAPMYALDITEAYSFGEYNYPLKTVENDPYAVVKKQAWNEGRIAAVKASDSKQSKVEATFQKAQETLKQTGKEVRGDHHAELEEGITALSLNESQKASYRLADQVAQAAKTDIVVYAGKTGEQGYYDPKTDKVHLNLNTTNKSGKSMMAFTLGHELVHRAKKGSPKKYQAFADFLMEQYGKQGSNVEQMIAQELQAAKDFGIKMTREQAFEEVVADACQRMLLDTDAGKKLAQFAAESRQNKSFLEDLKRWIMEFMEKLRSIFKDVEPDSLAAREFAKFDENVKQILADMYVDMTVDAGIKLSAIQAVVKENAETISSEEIITDGAVVTDGNELKYSIRSMKADIAEGQMFEDLMTHCGWTQKQVDELRKNLEDLVAYMTPFRDTLDMNETYGREGRRFSPYKPNSDPLYKISMDFSTLCSKRLLTQYVIENLQLRENRPMGPEEQMAIRDMLNEYRKVEKGLQVACAMCYVEAARLKSPKQISKWIADPAEQMKNFFADKNPDFAAFIKEKQGDFKESRGYDRNATKKDMSAKDVRELNKIRPRVRSQYQLTAEEAQIVERAKALPASTYLTAGNLAELSETDPVIYAAYTAFVRTATRSKSLETDEPYYYGDSRRDNGNGIIVSDSFIEAVNRENGMRFSSWSDWRIQHMLDYITAVIDNSVRGAAMHGYTKFGEEVRVLGKTGMMFNMSGVAGTQTGLNEDGSLSFSPTESIDVNEAIQLREEFPETAGLQCIGVGDDHIRALLRSDIIDYVIPYHVSGLNAGLRAMANIHGWADYTTTQHAAIDKSVKLENAADKEHWHEEPVFSEFFVGYGTGMTGIDAMRASADRYVQMCKDRGLKPKFEQFLKEENYWKLLIDRKMINQKTGNLIQQKPVTPTFDFKTIREVVDRHVKNYDSGLEARALNHIVENWDSIPKRIRDLKKQGGKKPKKVSKAVDTLANETLAAQPKGTKVEGKIFSLPKMDQEYMAAVERGDMDTAQRMVNERAEALRAEVFAQTDVPTYRIRRGPTPKKTIKVYKVFTMSSAGKPSALFVSSQYDLPVGVWLDAQDTYHFTDQRNGHMYVPSTKNPNTKGGATGRPTNVSDISAEDIAELEKRGYLKRDKNGKLPKSITSLAYRPGWHAGDLPFFPQGGMQIEGSNYPNVHRYNQVVFECEMIADHDYTDYHVTDEGKVQLHDMQEMPKDGSYKYSTNPMAQSTDIGSWYIGSSIRIVRALTQEECDRILQENGRPVQEWQAYQDADALKSAKADARSKFTDKKARDEAAKAAEYEYEHRYGPLDLDALGYDPTQTDGGKKLLDAVTYDDEGNVIPLSQRFNPEVEDVRYSLPKKDLLPKTQNKPYRKPSYDEWDVSAALDDALDHTDQHNENLIRVGEMPHFISDMLGIEGDFYIYRNHAYENMVSEKQAIKDSRPTMRKKKKIHFHDLGKQRMQDAILALENPIMTIADSTDKENPKIVMILPVEGNNDAPLYAAMSFYDDHQINGSRIRRPHLILTVAERGVEADDSHDGYVDVVNEALRNGRILSLDKEKMRAYLPVIADLTRVGGVADSALADNIARFRKEINAFREKNHIDYKLPVGEDTSPRALLANAFEGVVQNDIERRNLKQYQDRVEQLNAEEAKLQELRAEIKELSSVKGKRDTKRISELQFEANATANRINTLDKMLLRFEASAPLQNILKREKDMVRKRERQRASEALESYRNQKIENLEKRVERQRDNAKKAAMRQKVRKVIRDLDKLLNRGDKKQNVKEGMKDLVAEALATAEILFTDNYTNDDMVRDGVGTDLTPAEARYMEEARAILEELSNLPSGSYEAMMARAETEAKLKSRLAYRMSRLQDVFMRERARLNKTQVSEVLGKLADAYKSMESSEYTYIRDAFHDNVYQYLLMLKDDVGGTIVKDMSLGQLEELYKAYTMVLTTVRNANKMFASNLKETRDNLANRVMFEVRKAGGEHGKWTRAGKMLNSFSWNNQKPVYAFERIGSNTLTTLYQNIRKGQDTWAVDMQEADERRRALYEKYKRSGWDMEKQYKFTSSSGLDFGLNLEQIMSLYAYSKREQAHEHLLKGGFVFDGNTEVVETKHGIKRTYMVEDATSYNVSDEILAEIIGTLSEEQKGFVDEMQDYLSTTMGEKGNSISMQLYGVKLFNEKFYFPLRSAGQYMERAKEANLKKEQGQISIVNSGFAKATTPKASNPVVLSGFMDVWADHVNEMSMYHSFVLPMEDFRRVYNYSSPNMEGQPSVSVNQVIQNAYGAAATGYIDQLYRDLNGGAVTDPREGLAKSLVGKFKKAAVMASLSVVFQQPSAIGRAFALIDPDYFDTLAITRGVGRAVLQKGKHDQLWAELKKYAPVAMIKEMGYFDTGMGRSAKDFLQAEEYKGLGEKVKGFFKDSDYRDEALSKAAAVADELTWIQIWRAVKNETAKRNPKMDKTSEEFLKLAGERFSEVIDKTQVYDSVLARSANMRSKSLFMNIWTSFMAEPTTSINMVEDALRKGKNGQKKAAARTLAAVFCSILINSAFASLIYAARDDDEDETFLEKYLSSFLTEMLDGINPITYYPFLKDIWSALQGFDIERADMSLITDLVDVLQSLVKVYAEDTSSMSEAQLDAHNKKVALAWWKAADSASSLFGIPFKNIRREIGGIINFVTTVKADAAGRETTWSSFKDIVLEDVADSLPILGWLPNESKGDDLFDAILSGDEAYIERLMSGYKDEAAAESAIRSAIKEHYLAGDFDKKTTRNYLIEYGGLDVIEAHWKVDEWEFEKNADSGEEYGKYDNFYEAVKTGMNLKAVIQEYTDNGVRMTDLRSQLTSHFKPEYLDMSASDRASIKGYLLNAMVALGVDREDAEYDMKEWDFEAENEFAYSDRKTAYLNGDITREQLRRALIDFGGYEAENADAQIQVYDWMDMGYDNATISNVKKYNEFCKPAGVPIDAYLEIIEFSNNTENDTDPETGRKIAYSAVKKVMAQINYLPISNAQKTAIAMSLWKESTVTKYKLW